MLERYVRNGILISNGLTPHRHIHMITLTNTTHLHHTHSEEIYSVHHRSLYSDRVLFGFWTNKPRQMRALGKPWVWQPEKRNVQCSADMQGPCFMHAMQLNKAHPETRSGFQSSHRASAGIQRPCPKKAHASWIWAEKRARGLPEVRPTKRKGNGGCPY